MITKIHNAVHAQLNMRQYQHQVVPVKKRRLLDEVSKTETKEAVYEASNRLLNITA